MDDRQKFIQEWYGLEDFIYNYTPKIWKEHCGKVMSTPKFLEEEFKQIQTGAIPERYKKENWAILEAIQIWMKDRGIIFKE